MFHIYMHVPFIKYMTNAFIHSFFISSLQEIMIYE